MTSGYNTSVNQTRNTTYNYSPNQAPQVDMSGSGDTFNYQEIYDKGIQEPTKPMSQLHKPSADGVWGITISQTQNFTFAIEHASMMDRSFNLNNRDGIFLPVKSLDFKPVALEHLKIKAGIFADLPFFHRKKLGMFNVVMHDNNRSDISRFMIYWFNSCVNNSGYVPYIDDMCSTATYTEYTFDGKIATQYKSLVIPEGEISTNRVYGGDGDLTEYKFSLLIVGQLANSAGGTWREADWGIGYGPEAHYELRTAVKLATPDMTMSYKEPSIAEDLGY